jgi:hypothetical protein
VGYDSQGFWIQNSWGPRWGKGGFARVGYEDWLANGFDAWVARLGAPIVIDGKRNLGVTQGALETAQFSVQQVRRHVVSNGTGTTSIGGGGSVHVNNFRQRQVTLSDGTLSLRSRIDGGSSIRTDRVTIGSGSAGFLGAVDVADGGLMINAQTYSETRQKVAAARNGGAWNRGGITSRVARVTPGTTLGILTGAEYLSTRTSGASLRSMSLIHGYNFSSVNSVSHRSRKRARKCPRNAALARSGREKYPPPRHQLTPPNGP